MGGVVTSGKNCEKETGSRRCQGKNCRVRSECESGTLVRNTSCHERAKEKEKFFKKKYPYKYTL